MLHNRSSELFARAQQFIPGGVNSPVRAFKAVGGTPFFVKRGTGSHIIDADGNEYIDYVCSWGPLILGHAHPEVVSAATDAIKNGSSFGAPTEAEIQLASMICQAFPSIDMVRLVNSGTEAVMSAIRIARGFTGRSKLIKFAGCYHGHADYLLVKAGSGATTLGVPDSAGIPPDFAQLTVTLPYNDTDTFAQVMSDIGDEVAAVIVEPIAGNMGVVPPRHGFLEALRELTHKHNAVLIFDEVITGFRVCYGGAQTLYNIQPDMTVLGKIIGGGFPIGAYGGRREIMEQVAPLGPVYQAGTLSGNPVAVSAGIATLSVLKREIPYPTLERLSEKLATNMLEVAQRAGVQVQINRIGSMMTIFFSDSPVFDYQSALQADCNQFAKFFHAMLDKGIYLPPSQFEAMFVSMAHTDEDINATIEAARIAFSEVYSCM